MTGNRKLAAILAADVVGYSRLAGADEDRTLARLRALRSDLIDPTIAVHNGHVIKRTGDGALVEFRSVVDAVRCAIEVQNGMVERNAGVPQDRRIEFRIGIHLGDVVEESDGDLMGDGVNLAARLEGICEAGGICLSEDAFRQVRDKVKEQFVDLGEQSLKNIVRPLRAYRMLWGHSSMGNKAASDAASARLVLTDKPSIAVLPFANLSGDTEQQYFSDGITEDIITELSRFRSLFVIARNSSFQYRDKAVDITRIGRELGVQYVVEGSVRRSNDRIRITVQLVDAAAAAHLWAERYDRDLKETFAVQDEVTRTIVSMLAIRLEDEGLAAAKRKSPENTRAYDYWLRGKNCLGLWNREALFEARVFFEKAIEIDPDYARAYCGLALTYEWAAFYTAWGGDDPEAHETAEHFALKAAALDPTDHQPHLALGWIYQERRDFERSRRHIDRAEALNPNDADMLINKAMILSLQDEPILAVEYAQAAIRLNPYHPDWYLSYQSHCLMMAGRYEEAMALRAFSTSILPEARVYTAVLCVRLGQFDEARHQIDELIARFPSHWRGEATVSFFARKTGGYKNPSDVDAFIDALRKTGLPE